VQNTGGMKLKIISIVGVLLLAVEQAAGSSEQIQSQRSQYLNCHWCSKPVSTCIQCIFHN